MYVDLNVEFLACRKDCSTVFFEFLAEDIPIAKNSPSKILHKHRGAMSSSLNIIIDHNQNLHNYSEIRYIFFRKGLFVSDL